jgi:lysophospholipase L1-like esterase
MTAFALGEHALLRGGGAGGLSTGIDECPGQAARRPASVGAVIVLRRLVAVLATAVAGLAVATAPVAATPGGEVRTAVVALGDSAASGDGAGDYEPGTRGEGGNWCHRSPHAYVHRSGLADESVNLACSGADSAQVGFGHATQYGEGSQAARLVEVAGRHRVTVITLQVGANDDVALTATGIACIRAGIVPGTPPCRDTIGAEWPARTAATARKVEAAVRDVQEAMRRAGYDDTDYAFVLGSYASPVTERMVPLHAIRGCPYREDDAAWGRTVAIPELSDALRGVAERTGVRFLDLARATEGYEACSRSPRTGEWQRRITVDPHALVHGGLDAIGYHLFQESFHPNAAAHAEMARCFAEFVRSGAGSGACLVDADGHLRAELREPAPAAA